MCWPCLLDAVNNAGVPATTAAVNASGQALVAVQQPTQKDHYPCHNAVPSESSALLGTAGQVPASVSPQSGNAGDMSAASKQAAPDNKSGHRVQEGRSLSARLMISSRPPSTHRTAPQLLPRSSSARSAKLTVTASTERQPKGTIIAKSQNKHAAAFSVAPNTAQAASTAVTSSTSTVRSPMLRSTTRSASKGAQLGVVTQEASHHAAPVVLPRPQSAGALGNRPISAGPRIQAAADPPGSLVDRMRCSQNSHAQQQTVPDPGAVNTLDITDGTQQQQEWRDTVSDMLQPESQSEGLSSSCGDTQQATSSSQKQPQQQSTAGQQAVDSSAAACQQQSLRDNAEPMLSAGGAATKRVPGLKVSTGMQAGDSYLDALAVTTPASSKQVSSIATTVNTLPPPELNVMHSLAITAVAPATEDGDAVQIPECRSNALKTAAELASTAATNATAGVKEMMQRQPGKRASHSAGSSLNPSQQPTAHATPSSSTSKPKASASPSSSKPPTTSASMQVPKHGPQQAAASASQQTTAATARPPKGNSSRTTTNRKPSNLTTDSRDEQSTGGSGDTSGSPRNSSVRAKNSQGKTSSTKSSSKPGSDTCQQQPADNDGGPQVGSISQHAATDVNQQAGSLDNPAMLDTVSESGSRRTSSASGRPRRLPSLPRMCEPPAPTIPDVRDPLDVLHSKRLPAAASLPPLVQKPADSKQEQNGSSGRPSRGAASAGAAKGSKEGLLQPPAVAKRAVSASGGPQHQHKMTLTNGQERTGPLQTPAADDIIQSSKTATATYSGPAGTAADITCDAARAIPAPTANLASSYEQSNIPDTDSGLSACRKAAEALTRPMSAAPNKSVHQDLLSTSSSSGLQAAAVVEDAVAGAHAQLQGVTGELLQQARQRAQESRDAAASTEQYIKSLSVQTQLAAKRRDMHVSQSTIKAPNTVAAASGATAARTSASGKQQHRSSTVAAAVGGQATQATTAQLTDADGSSGDDAISSVLDPFNAAMAKLQQLHRQVVNHMQVSSEDSTHASSQGPQTAGDHELVQSSHIAGPTGRVQAQVAKAVEELQASASMVDLPSARSVAVLDAIQEDESADYGESSSYNGSHTALQPFNNARHADFNDDDSDANELYAAGEISAESSGSSIDLQSMFRSTLPPSPYPQTTIMFKSTLPPNLFA